MLASSDAASADASSARIKDQCEQSNRALNAIIEALPKINQHASAA
jgi:hypothetical protein